MSALPWHEETNLGAQSRSRLARLRGDMAPETLPTFHILALAAWIFFTFMTALHARGTAGFAAATLGTVICLTGLLFAHFARLIVGDLYRQMAYKDRFFAFLVHIAIMVSPAFFMGGWDWRVGLGVLIIALCFQAVDQTFCGRLYGIIFTFHFAGLLYVFAPAPLWLLGAWFGSALLTMRFGHLRFRVDDFGDGEPVDTGIFPRSLMPVVVPILVGGLAWELTRRFATPRAFGDLMPIKETASGNVKISFEEILWTLAGLIVLCTALVLLLRWFDSMLRRKQQVIAPEGDLGENTLRSRNLDAGLGPSLKENQEQGARERILRAFARLEKVMIAFGLPRGTAETATEYLARIGPSLELGAPPNGPFDFACYNADSPTAEEADRFVQAVDRAISDARRDSRNAT